MEMTPESPIPRLWCTDDPMKLKNFLSSILDKMPWTELDNDKCTFGDVCFTTTKILVSHLFFNYDYIFLVFSFFFCLGDVCNSDLGFLLAS